MTGQSFPTPACHLNPAKARDSSQNRTIRKRAYILISSSSRFQTSQASQATLTVFRIEEQLEDMSIFQNNFTE